jgi:hypothetical protein
VSTGKDPKTMPVTPEYAAGHERVFGKREHSGNAREVRVHMPDHPKANKWGSVDVRDIGDWVPGGKSVPIVDMSLSRKVADHEKATGSVHASNYGPDYHERAKKRVQTQRKAERRASIEKTIASFPTRKVEEAARVAHLFWNRK